MTASNTSRASLSDITLGADASAHEMKELYDAQGVLIVRQVVPTDLIRRATEHLKAMIGARLQSLGVPPGSEDLDALFNQLRPLDDEGRGIYVTGKDLIEFHEFVSLPSVTGVIKTLLGHDRIMINFDQNLLRIDRPFNDRETFNWHQDYPYNMLSRSAITTWAPLTPISADMGYLRAVPGSHRDVIPVEVLEDVEPVPFEGHNRIRLQDLEGRRADFEARSVEVIARPGDVLFFHSCLVHASGQNRSNRSRWVVNLRYGDMLDRELVERRWDTSRYRRGFIFADHYPDQVKMVRMRGQD